jgi:beta-lactamase superfamily II metal-dependent hydrolase
MWKRILAAVGISVVVGAGVVYYVSTTGDEEEFAWGLHIVVLDVGQADAIVMVAPNGDVAVVDAGHGSTAANKIQAFLADEVENGVGNLNRAKLGVVTHYDRDHVGGFASFGAALAFDRVIDQGPSLGRENATIYTDYLTWVGDPDDDLEHDTGELGIRKEAKVGTKWHLGEARIRVLSARGDTKGSTHDLALDPGDQDINENPGSIALLVTLGEFEFYTAGDQTSDDWKTHEPDTEIAVVNGGVLGDETDIDVFKANHHGSDTSNGREFLQALDPEVAIISSKLGGHGLPKRIAVKEMIDVGAFVYITGNGLDDNGEFTDSSATADDDQWQAPADSFINEAGDVHILVSADGQNYRVMAGDDWREFSSLDSENQ